MPVVKVQPSPLVRTKTKRDGLKDGDKPAIIVAEGSPLSRLQAVHDDEEAGVLVGDLTDTLAQCDPKDEVVAKLAKVAGNKKKGERVTVAPKEVEHVTALLIAQ